MGNLLSHGIHQRSRDLLQENLQYAIIGKFSYTKIEIVEFKKSIPNSLVAKFLLRIKINEENENTGELKSKWITIQYDHMPKYCKEGCL
ncbi:hypothetical protein H5410_021008 [Solanum commersonii]|uniref:Uncharacterized protein n=1 Tax=Solanum commersonii TaxID=4109 RepID=A0A9J5ZCS6_SOLCO|nr:hypothetical protein H5410_021008 [Solanum commersonii]